MRGRGLLGFRTNHGVSRSVAYEKPPRTTAVAPSKRSASKPVVTFSASPPAVIHASCVESFFSSNIKTKPKKRGPLTFQLQPFHDLLVMPFLFFLAFDPVEYERAQAQVAHEHDESDEPSADHVYRSGRSVTDAISPSAVETIAVSKKIRPQTISGAARVPTTSTINDALSEEKKRKRTKPTYKRAPLSRRPLSARDLVASAGLAWSRRTCVVSYLHGRPQVRRRTAKTRLSASRRT